MISWSVMVWLRVLHHFKTLLWQKLQEQQIQRLCHFVRMRKKSKYFGVPVIIHRLSSFLLNFYWHPWPPNIPKMLDPINCTRKQRKFYCGFKYFTFVYCGACTKWKNHGELWFGFHTNVHLSLFINKVPTFRQKICLILISLFFWQMI